MMNPGAGHQPNLGFLFPSSPAPLSPTSGLGNHHQPANPLGPSWQPHSMQDDINEQNRRNEVLMRQFTPHVHRLADEARRAKPSPATPRQERKP